MRRPKKRARKGPEKFKLVPKGAARKVLAALRIKSITFDGRKLRVLPFVPRGARCQPFRKGWPGDIFFKKVTIVS